MERFRKFFMVMALAVPMSFIPVKCARATAAGDIALLAQQVLQWLNDMDMDEWKIEELNEKFDALKSMANWISKGTSAYSQVRNITRLADKTERIVKKSAKFYRYVASIEDDDLEMDRIMKTTRVCINNVEYIYAGIGDIIEMVSNMGGSVNAKDVMDASNTAIEEGEANLDGLIDKTQDVMAEYVMMKIDSDLKKGQAAFDRLLIY